MGYIRKNVFWLVMIVGAGIVTGCQPSLYTKENTAKKVEEARELAEMTKPMDSAALDDAQVAESELQRAETRLEKKQFDQAYVAAKNSIDASKRILKRFYLQSVSKAVEKVKGEIEDTTKEDPDNPLKDFLPELDNMLAYAEELQQDDVDISAEKIASYTERTSHIVETTEKIIEEKIESDISFALGQYELSPQGNRVLHNIVRKILRLKDEKNRQYPHKEIMIKIKIVGYTDSTGFKKGTRLIQKLTEGFENTAPHSGIERRRFLNQRLSQFRAQTIGEYLYHSISEQTKHQVYIEQDIIGKGEELPPDVSSSSFSDSRRRICKIYSYVIAR